MILLFSLQNQLKDIIASEGWDPQLFSFDKKEEKVGVLQFAMMTETTIALRSKNEYWFKLRATFDFKEYIEYSPGNERREEVYEYQSWEQAKAVFKNWLTYLKREIEAEELWKASDIKRIYAIEGKNDKFSQEEIAKISNKLDILLIEFKKNNEVLGLNTVELEELSDNFMHMKEMSCSLNKKDWVLLFWGFFSSFFLQVSLNNEASVTLGNMLAWFFNATQLLSSGSGAP